jgi:hypothetical protein
MDRMIRVIVESPYAGDEYRTLAPHDTLRPGDPSP